MSAGTLPSPGPLQGYALFLAALYTMIGLMMVAVALSAWVAWCFRNRSFPAVWWVRGAGAGCRMGGAVPRGRRSLLH